MTQMCSEATLSLLSNADETDKTVCKDYYSSLDKFQGFIILPPFPPLSLWGYVTGLNPNPGNNPKHENEQTKRVVIRKKMLNV